MNNNVVEFDFSKRTREISPVNFFLLFDMYAAVERLFRATSDRAELSNSPEIPARETPEQTSFPKVFRESSKPIRIKRYGRFRSVARFVLLARYVRAYRAGSKSFTCSKVETKTGNFRFFFRKEYLFIRLRVSCRLLRNSRR